MINQPIPAKIIFTLKNTNLSGEEFLGLSQMLYQQNLIFSEPQELRKKKRALELIVIFQDISSFKNWLTHPHITNHWNQKFKTLLAKKPQTIQEKNCYYYRRCYPQLCM